MAQVALANAAAAGNGGGLFLAAGSQAGGHQLFKHRSAQTSGWPTRSVEKAPSSSTPANGTRIRIAGTFKAERDGDTTIAVSNDRSGD